MDNVKYLDYNKSKYIKFKSNTKNVFMKKCILTSMICENLDAKIIAIIKKNKK